MIIIAAAAVGSCSVLAALGIICTVVVTCYINKQRVQIKSKSIVYDVMSIMSAWF